MSERNVDPRLKTGATVLTPASPVARDGCAHLKSPLQYPPEFALRGGFNLNRLLRSLAVLLILTAPALYAADVKETIHVVITGGPNAGTYDGSTDRGGCSTGMSGKGSWGNQYSLVKENNPKVLN